MTTRKATSKSIEAKAADYFRTGVKLGYGKLFWNWIDTLRNSDQSRYDFATEVLKYPDATTFYRGINEGQLELEGLICALITLEESIQSVPEIPDKEILAVRGFVHAIDRVFSVPLSIQQFCWCWFRFKRNSKWALLREAIRREKHPLRRERLELAFSSLCLEINRLASGLLKKHADVFQMTCSANRTKSMPKEWINGFPVTAKHLKIVTGR